jgi:hypothetical protein
MVRGMHRLHVATTPFRELLDCFSWRHKHVTWDAHRLHVAMGPVRAAHGSRSRHRHTASLPGLGNIVRFAALAIHIVTSRARQHYIGSVGQAVHTLYMPSELIVYVWQKQPLHIAPT